MKTYADRHDEEQKIKRKQSVYSSGNLKRKMGSMDQEGIQRMHDYASAPFGTTGIQRKMDVSQPEDFSEVQADEVTESFMNGNYGDGADTLSHQTSEISGMQEGEGTQTSDTFYQQLESTKGQGRPLDGELKGELEDYTEKDLSHVKVHTGEESGKLTSAVDAIAFTKGNEIHFEPGAYDPSSEKGKELIMHEVAHTMQQGGGAESKIMRAEKDPPVYYTYRNITPFVPTEFVALSSYWYGMVSNYFGVTIGTAATLTRLTNNEEETDKLFYLIWQKRPPAIPNEHAEDKRYHYEITEPQVHVLQFNGTETVNGNSKDLTLYYEVIFGRGDNGPVYPVTSDIQINFLKQEETGKLPLTNKEKKDAEKKSENSMPTADPETTDGKMLTLIKNTISLGSSNSPFEQSFPDFTKEEFADPGDSRQEAFFKSLRGISGKNDLVRFAYDQYKIFKDYPVDKDNNRTNNGTVATSYYAADVIEVYWYRKSPPDKYMITMRLRESLEGNLDKETRKKEIEAIELDVSMITKLQPSDLSGYTQESASKDYTDARLEEDMNRLVHYPKHYVANILGLDQISDGREKTVIKFVAYQLVNYDNYSPVSIPSGHKSEGSFGFGKLYLNADAGAGVTLFRNSEFDLVIPVPQADGSVKYYYYSFNIEDADENATVTPLPNEDQAATARRAKKTINVTVTRIGEKGDQTVEADSPGNFNLKKIPGYPTTYSEKAAKTFVQSRYDYLNKSGVALDYTSETTFIDSLSKAIKSSISIEWFKNNYGINVLNTMAEAKAASAYNTDPDRLAVYKISDGNRLEESDEPENIVPVADEKSGNDVIAEKYNCELSSGIFKSETEYQARMNNDAVLNGKAPSKKVYDLYLGIKPWTPEELLILECALQTLQKAFVTLLSGASFFRQQMCLTKGTFNGAAGVTNGAAQTVALYDSAFAKEGGGLFVGGPSAVHSWSILPIVHEIGHLISGKLFTTTTKIKGVTRKKTDYFINEFIAYVGLLTTVEDGEYKAPSNYSRSTRSQNGDLHEFFADAFMLYNLDQDFLLNYYPEIYWWFNAVQTKGEPTLSEKLKKEIDDKKTKGTLRIR